MRWPSAETLRTHSIRGAHFDELDRRLRARRAGVPGDPFGLPGEP